MRGLAKGYTTFALSDPEPIEPEGRGWVAGAGGIYSTPGDLVKWDLALMSGKVLKPASYALMTTPRVLKGGKLSEYGCGLSVRTQNGRQVLGHGGAVSGFNAGNSMVPSTRSAVVMMSNIDGGLGGLPAQVLSLLLKEPTILPNVQGVSSLKAVEAVFAEMQSGKLNRAKFAEEFNIFLSDEKAAGAAKRLKPYGKPTKYETVSINERGGMEVSVTRLTVKGGPLRVLMYRKPDGIIEQFFVSRE